MPFYISDILPYLSKDCKKQLEIQLGIILRDSSKSENLKFHIIQEIKNTYVDKLKKILISPNEHVIKKMFLEGGFIEKTEINYPTFDFPVIELNDYYYLPLELYEAILKDDFFKENRYVTLKVSARMLKALNKNGVKALMKKYGQDLSILKKK